MARTRLPIGNGRRCAALPEHNLFWDYATHRDFLNLARPLVHARVDRRPWVALSGRSSELRSKVDVDGEEPCSGGCLPVRDERLPTVLPRSVCGIDETGVKAICRFKGSEGFTRAAFEYRERPHVRVTTPFLSTCGSVASSAPPTGEPGTKLNLVLLNLSTIVSERG